MSIRQDLLTEKLGIKIKNSADCVLLGLFAATAWTLLGVAIAYWQGELSSFISHWVKFQGFFTIGCGVSLTLLHLSANLPSIRRGLNLPTRVLSKRTKLSTAVFISVVGTVSLVSLGFPAVRLVLAFMIITCGLICLMASAATIQALELLSTTRTLHDTQPELHPTSPADTPCLRRLAEHAAIFGLFLSIGYGFAFAGTLVGEWKGSAALVDTVQVFWPTIYVPLCLTVLLLPHAYIYSTIRERKDELIERLNLQIQELSAGSPLSHDRISEINSLADLTEKIEKAPSYPSSLRIMIGLIITVAINLTSLLAPREALAEVVRTAIGQ